MEGIMLKRFIVALLVFVAGTAFGYAWHYLAVAGG